MQPEQNTVDFNAHGKLFSEAISSDFGDFVRESVDFYDRHGQIGEMILADQKADGLRKKHERAREWNDQMLGTRPMEGFEDCDLAGCSLELGTGRPRMEPVVVFVLLMLRGRIGGPCRKSSRELLLESRSLEEALSPYINALPGETTILENLNILSDKTVETIHRLQLEEADLPPLARERAGIFATLMGDDALDASKTLKQCIGRIEEGRLAKARERVLGVADRAAAIIVKGGREPLMGYKPQLARSGSGLVTALIVESGNPSDSANLEPMLRRSIENTGVVPSQASVDGGYASGKGLEGAKALGVDEVSIGGAKGRKLLGEEWDLPSISELRSWRSSVESLMFVLKHGYRFGRLGRTGLKAVRRELTEKVIAYNQDRLILLRKQKQNAQAPPKAA